MPQPNAKDSGQLIPPKRPLKSAAELPEACDYDQPKREQDELGIRQNRRIGRQAGQSKKHGHEKPDDQASELLVNVAGQNRRLPDQNTGDKGAEYGMDADRVGDQRHCSGYDKDRRDDRDH